MYWIDINATPKQTPRGEQRAFFADAVSDISNLPTSSTLGVKQGDDNESYKCVLPGATCLVIATGELYMLDSTDTWVKI